VARVLLGRQPHCPRARLYLYSRTDLGLDPAQRFFDRLRRFRLPRGLDPGFSAGNLICVPVPRDPSKIRVIPSDPDGSFLIQKLDGGPGTTPRRSDAAGRHYLDPSTINVMRQWIQDGAPQ
jgi:hypothetical protein